MKKPPRDFSQGGLVLSEPRMGPLEAALRQIDYTGLTSIVLVSTVTSFFSEASTAAMSALILSASIFSVSKLVIVFFLIVWPCHGPWSEVVEHGWHAVT